MANTLLTINLITREAVRLWKNSNAFIQNVDMQYDESFAVSGAKIGSTLRPVFMIIAEQLFYFGFFLRWIKIYP